MDITNDRATIIALYIFSHSKHQLEILPKNESCLDFLETDLQVSNILAMKSRSGLTHLAMNCNFPITWVIQ